MVDTLEFLPEHPLHTAVWADASYENLDPGIRFAVRALHAAGISTCQSCQGGTGHAYEYPSIDMVDGRAFEAMTVLERHGISVRGVLSIWRIQDGVPEDRVWRIELREDVGGMVDQRPQFLTAHLHRDCWTGAL